MDDATVTHFNHPTPPPPGSRSLVSWGPFQIIQKVGQGGFGEVYQAFDTTLQREVALKLLRPRGLDTSEEAQEMLREARQMAKVRHPNVMAVHGVDTHDGRVGFWGDFVHGKTLSALLAANGPMSASETSHIGIDLAKAVGAVHAAGLLHRDIKASNAMREEGGRILLMDFGLSQEIKGEQAWSGTPAYMAPELIAGKSATLSTDIYSLGALLFHLLTGKYPYSGETWEVVKAAQESGTRARLLDLRPDLPEAFASVVERAADPDPAKRYTSAGEMIGAIAGAIGPTTHSFTMPPSAANPVPEPKGWFRTWMLVPVLVVIGLTGWLSSSRLKTSSGPGANKQLLEAHDRLDHYYKAGNTEKAIELLEKFVAQYPDNASAFADLARANLYQFRSTKDPKYYEPTIAYADKALELNKKITSAHVTLAVLYTQTGKYDLATEQADAAVKLDALDAEAHFAQWEVLFQRNQRQEAGKEILLATQLAPKDWRFQDQLATYYERTGDPVKELPATEEAVRLSPDNARALSNLGRLYKRLGRLQDAKAAYTKALALDETDPSLYGNLGVVLSQERNFTEAARMMRRAVELNPNSADMLDALGFTYAQMPGHEADSKKAFEECVRVGEGLLKLRPKDAVLLSNVSKAYAALGDASKAMPMVQQSLLLAPTSPQVLIGAAAVYELSHRRPEAIGWIQKALENGASLVDLNLRPEFDALRADPQFSVVRKKLEKSQN